MALFRGRKTGSLGIHLCLPAFFQEPHSRGHLSRPEAQSLSPYTTSANRAKLLAKNRQTFLLQTTKLTRLARRMCRDLLQPRRAARRPYAPINANAIKAECKQECWLVAVRGAGQRPVSGCAVTVGTVGTGVYAADMAPGPGKA